MSQWRRNYGRVPLRRADLLQDPYAQLQKWLDEASKNKLLDPNAMVLATAGENGQPATRVILLKYIEEDGLVFFTHHRSQKVKEIEENPKVSLNFYWAELMRQVRIEGRVAPVTREFTESYFSSRPRESQIEAWASQQDVILKGREDLERAFAEVERTYRDQEIPCPSFWEGYKVAPELFEFWQGGEHRMHDRFQFLKREDTWEINRLSP